jgi:hypothetical protein
VSTDTEVKETATAGAFVIFCGLALGGIGILIAALAVGLERAWTGRAARPRSEWADRLDYHTAWLDHDRRSRAAYRKARRDWLADGGDPDREPLGAPKAKRFSAWLHRIWSRSAVGSDRTRNGWSRFREGFRAGLENARQVSSEGGGVREMWRRRHGVVDPEPVPAADGAPDVASDSAPVSDATDMPLETADVVDTVDLPRTTPIPTDTEPNSTEDPMAAPNQTANTASTSSASSAGETNADQAAANLDGIGKKIAIAEELNDEMAAQAEALAAAAQAAAEHVSANGGTAATIQAVDEARALAEQMKVLASQLADVARAAADATSAASAGLKPAQDAQDTLHSAGATGRFVDTATTG